MAAACSVCEMSSLRRVTCRAVGEGGERRRGKEPCGSVSLSRHRCHASEQRKPVPPALPILRCLRTSQRRRSSSLVPNGTTYGMNTSKKPTRCASGSSADSPPARAPLACAAAASIIPGSIRAHTASMVTSRAGSASHALSPPMKGRRASRS
eukprot:scaffold1991_cov111-Isochrysis_galbana.AAC.6